MKAGFAGWRETALSRPDNGTCTLALPQAARFRQAGIPVVVNLPGELNLHDVAICADALVATAGRRRSCLQAGTAGDARGQGYRRHCFVLTGRRFVSRWARAAVVAVSNSCRLRMSAR
jgi:hypothetical protein